MILDIDLSLQPGPVHNPERAEKNRQQAMQRLLANTIPEAARGRQTYPHMRDSTQVDYSRPVTVGAGEQLVETSVPSDAALYHDNYVAYLCEAYNRHVGIVLTPDIIWHAILHELTTTVTANPALYGHLFTTDPDKKTSIVVNGGGNTLPMEQIVLALRALVPTTIDPYLPEFSTTDAMARFVHATNFAEMCSPYYSYSMLLCGYRRIDVRGTLADYEKILDHARQLAAVFGAVEPDEAMLPPGGQRSRKQAYQTNRGYLRHRLIPFLENEFLPALRSGDGAFFGEILTAQRCGSGSQIEVDGWWVKHMYKADCTREFPHNTPTQKARIEYKDLNTGRDLACTAGLFYSRQEGEFLVPYWGYVVNEKVEAQAAVEVPQPAPRIEVQRIEVTSQSRILTAKYTLEVAQPLDFEIGDEAVEMLLADLSNNVKKD